MNWCTDKLRRPKNVELKAFSATLPVDVIEMLKEKCVQSRRGDGNLSAFLEVGALLAYGIFFDPVIAEYQIERLLPSDATKVECLQELQSNLAQVIAILQQEETETRLENIEENKSE